MSRLAKKLNATDRFQSMYRGQKTLRFNAWNKQLSTLLKISSTYKRCGSYFAEFRQKLSESFTRSFAKWCSASFGDKFFLRS